MITAERALNVARSFDAVAQRYGDKGFVDMGHVRVSKIEKTGGEYCGTVACHAGWYFVSKGFELYDEDYPTVRWASVIERIFGDASDYRIEDLRADYRPDTGSFHTSFTSFVDILVEDLGFSWEIELTCWAEENPDIWGNEFGYSMLSSSKAFGKQHFDSPVSIQEIAEHWHGVAQRLTEKEASENDNS